MTEQERIEELEATVRYLRKKLDAELDYHEWIKNRKIRGNVAGYIMMPISEVIEHNFDEDREKLKQSLRKIANNPILSEDVRDTMVKAIRSVNQEIAYRKQYYELLKKVREKNGR